MKRQTPKERRAAMFLQPLREKKIIERGLFRNVEAFIEFAKMAPHLADLARYGDPVTLDRYLALRASLPDLRPPAQYDSPGYDVAGSFVDVGRYVTGEPECMVHFNAERPVRLIDVIIMDGRPHNTTDYAVMRWFGLSVDLIDRLELAGYRCRVSMLSTLVSDRRPEVNICGLRLKEHDQPLDLGQMAALLMNNKVMSELYKNRFDQFGSGWCPDWFPEFGLDQHPDRITIPTLYYQNLYKRTNAQAWQGADLPWMMDLLGLNFLL
ncbi:DUF7192 family protein [Spirosoma sordidisoli]|uniref:DUF7192 domain-containing protein n=1 Tax=Spirosoma sordidisoli TaxID=2502893 RepID=A0A4Q2UGI0_9BACT|nr:hypothetical protein [Spirosoma sordidisoli]RYC66370.1 hypothetical protein EQG79_30315 [Spirosoma sordidisoli]